MFIANDVACGFMDSWMGLPPRQYRGSLWITEDTINELHNAAWLLAH